MSNQTKTSLSWKQMHLKSLSCICSWWCDVMNMLTTVLACYSKTVPFCGIIQTKIQAVFAFCVSPRLSSCHRHSRKWYVYTLFFIKYKFYIRRYTCAALVATLLRKSHSPHSLTDTETQSVNVKTCMYPFSHISSVFI